MSKEFNSMLDEDACNHIKSSIPIIFEKIEHVSDNLQNMSNQLESLEKHQQCLENEFKEHDKKEMEEYRARREWWKNHVNISVIGAALVFLITATTNAYDAYTLIKENHDAIININTHVKETEKTMAEHMTKDSERNAKINNLLEKNELIHKYLDEKIKKIEH